MRKFKVGDNVRFVSDIGAINGWNWDDFDSCELGFCWEGVVTAVESSRYLVDFGGDEWLMAEEEIEARK